MDFSVAKKRVAAYKRILKNTKEYRKKWNESLKPEIISVLERILDETSLEGKINVRDEIENLEAISLSLGHDISGIAEKFPDSISKRPYIKSNGVLLYQQLFNGKVMIMIMYPYIEGYGQPKPPKNLEILRPEEFKDIFILRHVEAFLKEIIEWEDFDDDVPEKMGINPIGFSLHNMPREEEAPKE